ncbi:hypothetical protein [Botrimarina mediterranea]|uniref:Uncharacterized protein n=1 Tax=Botrimarina mediterranea TaxID=2528022 RepID=A0A518KCW9_9BACT|nr:hypothetical protein [Botrimarina mediterranea]QDV75628.1 hypothetical protein Spa11_38480 [Botrimarina mediterranea]QDV80263.1 hypothetical protein K2D_38890 [Planctomycetes bacterium K2D]
MSLPKTTACFAGMLLVCCWIPPAFGEGFESLMAKVPSDVNLVVMVNAEKIFASEAGVAGGWRQEYQSRFAAAPLRMPPDARQYVLAASIDLATLTPSRETAVTRINTDLSIPMVQRLVGGSLDEIAGREVVSTPRDGHIIKLGPSEFAIVRPSDRQSTGRWLSAVIDRDKPALSPYLAKAAQYPDRVGTELIMALDLTGAVGQAAARDALNGSKVLADEGVDLDQAAAVLASVRGLTLGARVTDHVSGSLKVDFEQSVSPLEPVAKPLMLEVLAEAGLAIDEFNDWKPQTDEHSIRLSGELTGSGLRRIFSLFELDGTVLDQAADDNGGGVNPSEDRYAATADATLAYFRGIEEHLKDLSREHGASSYYTIGRWFDKYAKRIDRMPILNVDPELVEFGSQVVGQLRDCVDAIKGSGIRSEARGASVEPVYDYYPVFVGSNYAVRDDMREVESQRRAIRANEQAQSSTTVRGVVRQMQDGMSGMRRHMTQKYQVEF